MPNPYDDEAWERNRRFNALVKSLPTREQVIGQMADGTQLTAQVPTLFPENSGE